MKHHSIKKKIQQIENLQSEISKNEELKSQLVSLKTENFVLQQKVQREQEHMRQVNNERLKLEYNLEMGSEKEFNESLQKTKTVKNKITRKRSMSVPPQLELNQEIINSCILVPNMPGSPLSHSNVLKEAWIKVKQKLEPSFRRRYAVLFSSGQLMLYDWNNDFKSSLTLPELIDMDLVKSVSPGRDVIASPSLGSPPSPSLAGDNLIELCLTQNDEDLKYQLHFENSTLMKEWLSVLQELISM